jgi:hypothetical protein
VTQQAQELWQRTVATAMGVCAVLALGAAGVLLLNSGGSVRVEDPRPQPSVGLTAPATPGPTILPSLPPVVPFAEAYPT